MKNFIFNLKEENIFLCGLQLVALAIAATIKYSFFFQKYLHNTNLGDKIKTINNDYLWF